MEDDEKDQTTGKKEGKSNNQTERRGRAAVRRLLATNIYGRQAPTLQQITEPSSESPTIEEIRTIIQGSAKDKAPGPDDI